MRPIAIDLFAGAGGMSLGVEQAGFDIAAAVELDPIHAATHKFNFPETVVVAKSVEQLTGRDIRCAAGIGNRTVDLVVGGAPCQGFSLMGQRALDDPRNKLVHHFVRLVTELDANYFIFENVKGLTVGSHKRFLEELIREFARFGYDVHLPWRVLNASDFNVPQNRERLFLLGSKSGLTAPKYPAPTTHAVGEKTNATTPEGPSCFDAIGDLPDAENYAELRFGDEVLVEDGWGKPSSYAAALRCTASKGWYYGHRRIWQPELLTSSMRTTHTAISRRRFAMTPPGTVEPISRFFRLPVWGISNTLRAGTDSARGAFTSPRPIHYLYSRCITVREMARLHGFPDWFRFHSTKWHGARQVGNAVPPPLAKAVAASIIEATQIDVSSSRRKLELGATGLLRMGMAEAASYWNEPVPIARRTYKSGAKKRKQHEIELDNRQAVPEVKSGSDFDYARRLFSHKKRAA